FLDRVWTCPLIVTLLHRSICFHILRHNPDAVPRCILWGIDTIFISGFFIAGGRLPCKCFQLSEDPLKTIGDRVRLVELAFLSSGQARRAWGRRLGSQSWMKPVVREERGDPGSFRGDVVRGELRKWQPVHPVVL